MQLWVNVGGYHFDLAGSSHKRWTVTIPTVRTVRCPGYLCPWPVAPASFLGHIALSLT